MKDYTSRIPLPITALALGWVILGTVFQGEIPFLRDVCMVISLLLLLMTMTRVIRHPRSFYASLKSPIGLSMFSSFSLTLIMISVWMKGIFGKSNFYIWVAGVVLHTIIFIIFTVKYFINIKDTKVYATWFLIYTGLGMAIITCRDFGMIIFGKFTFAMIVITTLIISPFVIFSMFLNGKSEKNAAKPFFSLITIPLGIIIPAYIFTAETISIGKLMIMFYMLQILFVIVLLSIFIQIFNGFYSSWSCYTLSSSITLYATSVLNNLMSHNRQYDFLQMFVVVEYVIVFTICLAVLFAYLVNIISGPGFISAKLNLDSNEKIQKAKKKIAINRRNDIEKKKEERLIKRAERRNRASEDSAKELLDKYRELSKISSDNVIDDNLESCNVNENKKIIDDDSKEYKTIGDTGEKNSDFFDLID
ncbi:hypothetical protein [Peptostreptococcus canis]|uniref:Exfoliative toxin A/B n=1 Tax=Peptostreptococcus canis TaxID=1159213 RepID=A0ABR6TMZ7_9FIRM|nr:hypothetical protein [Peptostreptococcus canis]MBC2576513.1 hypothetical protein [Peptostreptococcus canis]MBP1998651.1 tellurite resistance protein TehA-like permease [Peptostreptococcus canis]